MKQEEVLEKERKKKEREEKRRSKEEEKKQKTAEREKEKKEKRQKQMEEKERVPGPQPHVYVFMQVKEVSSNKCAACLGLYKEDISDEELLHEWVQCTDQYCNKWMHSGCLQRNEDGL